MIFLSLIVSLLTYKWRYLANYIWFLELAQDIVTAFQPKFYTYDKILVLKGVGDSRNLSPPDFVFTLFYTD